MPIYNEFPKNTKIIGKHMNAADGLYHFVSGQGKTDANYSKYEPARGI